MITNLDPGAGKDNKSVPLTDDKLKAIAKEFCQRILEKYQPPEQPSMSLLEIVMTYLIAGALEGAKRHKISSSAKQASYVMGYISTRMPLREITISFNGRKQKFTDTKKLKIRSYIDKALEELHQTDKKTALTGKLELLLKAAQKNLVG